ncbi:hypothetical protein [Mammaliicoccus sciuri]|uniref:hypothetical protein n=1 Tax=Mammaliicoccus sciuri TaxID=1296 RepID=UPI0018B0235B|nr:hypothetical protein [Mammaliicoccus sciuri]MBF9298763.1 hypothetical protein [Staphylococcus schleiferi]MDO0948180.1 hypothetical protein [Mammaliicoccus sciuri]MDO0953449.1 hypothetical protein [Mammaliicoccus sciuri]
MDKTRLVNLATDLMIKQIYSGLECSIETLLFDDGTFSIQLTHLDDRYEYNNETLRIYEWQSDEQILSTFEQMKDVIAGERLIENE